MNLADLRSAILPLRQALLEHPLYEDLRNPRALRTFMAHHVFAVWDFMSLLKALQQRLTCVSVPWVPPGSAADGRLINEIVVAEETDENGRGGYASHFDLYHRAMANFGADTSKIDALVDRLRRGQTIRSALAEISPAIQRFVGHTFAVIESDDPCRIASAFTFGREDLLPAVFQRIVDELSQQAGNDLDEFKYYLLRHVELDGGTHGPMAFQLVTHLCGADERKWRAAQETAITALQERLVLWDAIHEAILDVGRRLK